MQAGVIQGVSDHVLRGSFAAVKYLVDLGHLKSLDGFDLHLLTFPVIPLEGGYATAVFLPELKRLIELVHYLLEHHHPLVLMEPGHCFRCRLRLAVRCRHRSSPLKRNTPDQNAP